MHAGPARSPSTEMTARVRTLLSPEARLLLLTSGGSANDAGIAAIARRGLDWHRLTRIAEAERAEPVLVRRLRAVTGAGLPAEAARLEQLPRVARSDERRAGQRT